MVDELMAMDSVDEYDLNVENDFEYGWENEHYV
jgi:hypothetical protein